MAINLGAPIRPSGRGPGRSVRELAVVCLVAAAAGCTLGRTLPPTGGLSASASPAASMGGLEAYLDSLAYPAFSGVVVVAKDFAPVASRAVGFSDRATGARNELTTAFDVGSVGKLLTAIAVGQLVEAGKVGMDEPLGRYLTGLPAELSTTVTIRELLGHRAGTGDFLNDPAYLRSKDGIRTVGALLRVIDLQRPLLFSPGSGWSYSNTGYALLGGVIEAASGEDFYDYVRRHILSVGLLHTGYYEKTSLPSFAAIGYDPSGAPNSDTLGLRGTPAGGVYASALDLVALHAAWHRGELLDPATSAEITRLVAPPQPAGATARATGALPDGLFAGGEPGANAVLGILDDTATTIVVLANDSPPMAESVADQLRPYVLP